MSVFDAAIKQSGGGSVPRQQHRCMISNGKQLIKRAGKRPSNSQATATTTAAAATTTTRLLGRPVDGGEELHVH